MKVTVVGIGYVGLPTGAVLADLGHNVTCVDRDPEKVATIQRAESPIFEPGIEDLLKKVLATGNFQVTTSLPEAIAEADVVFIAVGTPSGNDGRPEMDAVFAVAKEIGQNLDHPIIVVNKSTVPVGTADQVKEIILDQGANPEHVSVASNPEFLREGSAVADSYKPDRIVIGTDSEQAATKLEELYSPLNATILKTDVQSAELIKYASNSFLATKISFINAMSRICELCDADVEAVAEGMGMDKRIGRGFLNAGLGWGGSCFPKDVKGLATTSSDLGYDIEILRSASDINTQQVTNVIERLEQTLDGLNGKTITLLGLAFKPNTDDIRDAKSTDIYDALKQRGAKVKAHDPVAMNNFKAERPEIELADNPYSAAQGAHAVILVTEWAAYSEINLTNLKAEMAGQTLFDGRRLFNQEQAEQAGLTYLTVGLKSKFE